MTRINTNVPSLVGQNRLAASNKDLQTALTRLSTGLRINSGSDDPAGLIASEALRSEITSLTKALSNTRRASQIISTADSALGQVSSLLNDVRGLVVEAANSGALSDDEIAANQLQIDSSLEAINRIAQSTTFQGRKLLDGSLDFISTAGNVDSVSDINIDQANLGATGQIDVEVVISAAAEQASISASASAFSASAAANASADTGGATATQTINGESLSIVGPATLTSIAIVDDVENSNTGAASFDADTGVLTITGNFTGTGTLPQVTADASATAIQTAIDALDGISATGATAAGTAAAATAATVTATTGTLAITATNAGSEYNNVAVEFVSGTAGGGNSADFDSEQKILTVTVDSEYGQTAADLATAIDSATVDGSAPSSALFSAVGTADTFIDIANEPAAVSTGTTGGQVLSDDLVFQLNGASGAETFNFGAGTSADQISAAINLVSDSTGVSAAFDGALTLTSTAYGAEALVNIDVIDEGASGTFTANLDANRSVGVDIAATINGVEAKGTGNSLSINTSSLDLNLTVDDASSTNFSFSITGGGALFQLGPNVASNQQARLGISSVSTGQIGGPTGRLYELGSGQAKSLTNDITGASQIIDEVINKVTSLRGRLGAFQATTLDSNLASLAETQANLQEAESSIRDADFAAESANLTRSQILVQSGTNVLALANQTPQNVLSLLG